MDSEQPDPKPCALVVDDDSLIRMDIVDILEEAGFRTLEAPTGDEALKVLHEHHSQVSVLFTDVQMPGHHDGFALARRTASTYPHISIVVASGRFEPGPDDMPGGARFIGKPFSAKMVHRHLQEALPDEQKPPQLKR